MDWTKQVGKAPKQPESVDWTSQVGRSFDQASAQRDAETVTTVNVPRLERAQQLRDLGLVDPRMPGNPDVPIENFMRTEAPQIQPAQRANFGAALKSNLVEDPDTQRRLIAGSLFPNDPNGVNRVGMLDGRPVFVNDRGQLESVSTGGARFGAGILANAPEAVAGIVGSFSPLPVVGGTLGAMGARGLKRAAAGAITGEPQTIGGNLRDVAGEGALNAGAGLLGKGLAAVAGRGKIIDFTPSEVKTAAQAREYIKQSTGIDVDLAQASGNNKLVALRAFAARYPGKSAELVQAFQEAQGGQLDNAVSRVMGVIGKSAPAEVAGGSAMNAARTVIDLAKASRDEAARPFYEAARKVSISGDVAEELNKDPVLRFFGKKVETDPLYQKDLGVGGKPELLTLKGGERSTVKVTDAPGSREAKLLEFGTQKVPDTKIAQSTNRNSVGFWHQVQQAIDDAIAKNANEPNRVRILTQARKDLNSKLEAASPEFREANAYWSRVTRETVEPLEASAVGVLARISSPKAATAAGRIFSDPNISAAEIRATRASIVQTEGGEDAWNGLVRTWVAQNWNKALKETQGGSAVNPAGKLRQALIGTPDQRAKIGAMLPANAVQAFDDLMTAAQALSRTPTAGSNTFRDTAISEQLKGQGGVLLKWLTSARQTATRAAEDKAVERNVLALTEAILDPAKQRQLRVVVRMSDGAKKASVLSSILAGQATARASETGEDRMPSAIPLMLRR
jgi:hypothetical protein